MRGSRKKRLTRALIPSSSVTTVSRGEFLRVTTEYDVEVVGFVTQKTGKIARGAIDWFELELRVPKTQVKLKPDCPRATLKRLKRKMNARRHRRTRRAA